MKDIQSVKFNLVEHSFEITFQGGTVYKYPDLTQEDYERMVTADNLDRAVKDKIRDGVTVGLMVATKEGNI